MNNTMKNAGMNEIGDDTIYFNKNTIDSEKYFCLFKKYIPVFDKTSNILIFLISNPVAIMRMMEKNPGARYIIVDEKETFKTINILVKTRDFECVFINIDNFDWYNINMKFDCIIMNPPYAKNLHLKILEQAIKQLKDDNSVVVNLSPVRWLQDPVAQYKKNSDFYKFENSISKHIINLDLINSHQAYNIFNAQIPCNLGIYYIKKNYESDFYKDICFIETNKNHFNKVIKQWNCPNFKKYNEDNDKFFVTIRLITCIYGKTAFNICSFSSNYFINKYTKDNVYWKDSLYKSTNFSENRMPWGISFKTAKEAKNFYESTLTIAYKYFVSLVTSDKNVNAKFLPWMGDAINPRTGLKGYESEWTNEDFYQYFNITAEEQKVIEEEMKKY